MKSKTEVQRTEMFQIKSSPKTLLEFMQAVADHFGVGQFVEFDIDTELMETPNEKFQFVEYQIVGALKDKDETRYNWSLETELKRFWLFSSKLANEHARCSVRKLSKHYSWHTAQDNEAWEWVCEVGKRGVLDPGARLRKDISQETIEACFGPEDIQQEVLIRGVALFLDKFLSDAKYHLTQEGVL